MSSKFTPFSGENIRRMIRGKTTAFLSTSQSGNGAPYGSLVNVATDFDGTPLVLISDLAWHTANLLSDSRTALLIEDTDSFADALEGPRVTIMGRFIVSKSAETRDRFLAHHPSASAYADFTDFSFWRMTAKNAHAVAGFGRIETHDCNDIFFASDAFEQLRESSAEIIAHMNDDHAGEIADYANALCGKQPGPWKLSAIDPDGATLNNGVISIRANCTEPAHTPDQARSALSTLAKQARAG